MPDHFSSQELKGAQKLLNELFNEVSAEESPLAAGTKLGTGGNALQSLLKTKISFGNPKDNLVRLTETLFQDIGIEITQLHKQQMSKRFNFYYMTLSVSMQPGRGTQFTRIECALDFAPKGENEPIVQTIFPKSEWKEILTSGVELNLGLNGNLEWIAGISLPDMVMTEELSGSLKAKVATKNELNAFITITNYSFELGRTEIAAVGEGNSKCFWRIEKPDLRKTQTVKFGIVFKVPKVTKSIELNGMVLAEPSFNWLTANMRYVFEHLSDNLKKFLLLTDDERQGIDRLPIGDHEKLTILLPE